MIINEMLGVSPGEKPLDQLILNGGFCGIFRTIACIGDSLSSGEFESLILCFTMAASIFAGNASSVKAAETTKETDQKRNKEDEK